MVYFKLLLRVRILTPSITSTQPPTGVKKKPQYLHHWSQNSRDPQPETEGEAERLHQDIEAADDDELVIFEEQLVLLLIGYGVEEVIQVETVSVIVQK